MNERGTMTFILPQNLLPEGDLLEYIETYIDETNEEIRRLVTM